MVSTLCFTQSPTRAPIVRISLNLQNLNARFRLPEQSLIDYDCQLIRGLSGLELFKPIVLFKNLIKNWRDFVTLNVRNNAGTTLASCRIDKTNGRYQDKVSSNRYAQAPVTYRNATLTGIPQCAWITLSTSSRYCNFVRLEREKFTECFT